MGTVSDQMDAVRAQMTALDLLPDSLDLGSLRRCRTADDRGSKRNGWYVLHEFYLRDGRTLIVGAFGNWKSGESRSVEHAATELSREEQAEYRRMRDSQRAAAEAERRALQRSTAERARRIFEKLPEGGACAYLTRKKVRNFGVRFSRGALVVPVRRLSDDVLVSLQFINPDGSKKFLTGGEKKGCGHVLGHIEPTLPLLVAEGYATAATLHEATGFPVVVAFDAGNLHPVAHALRSRYPDIEIVIAGDDDRFTDGNPGRTKAMAAAEAVMGLAIFPVFVEQGRRAA